MPLTPPAVEVLEFWFSGAPPASDDAGRPNSAEDRASGVLGAATQTNVQRKERPEWFRKSDAFDALVRERFGTAVAAAVAGAFGEWCDVPHGALARIILLDQFTRNIGRDTPFAFSGDERALATADDAIARGFESALDPYERWFLYMPFEHCEDPAAQDRSVALFERLAAETGVSGPLDWARRHAEVIRRFGRFPHRNRILGRASTAEEVEFLSQPGSSF